PPRRDEPSLRGGLRNPAGFARHRSQGLEDAATLHPPEAGGASRHSRQPGGVRRIAPAGLLGAHVVWGRKMRPQTAVAREALDPATGKAKFGSHNKRKMIQHKKRNMVR